MGETNGRRPVLVKADDGRRLGAFTPEQRAQLRAWMEAERVEERQAFRDAVQGLGLVASALRRLAGLK